MFTCYFDDSSDRRREEFFCIGGFMAPGLLTSGDSGWDYAECLWMDATHTLTHPFRATDCETRNGQFSNWPPAESTILMKRLTRIIADSHVVPFAFLVHVPDFDSVFPKSKGQYGALKLATAFAISSVANYALGVGQGVRFVFEDSEAMGPATAHIYHSLKGLKQWHGAASLSSFTLKDKHSCGLQAADLIAREAFKYMDNLESTSREADHPKCR